MERPGTVDVPLPNTNIEGVIRAAETAQNGGDEALCICSHVSDVYTHAGRKREKTLERWVERKSIARADTHAYATHCGRLSFPHGETGRYRSQD